MSWWNGHVKTLGLVNVNALSWDQLKQMLIVEYYPREDMQKLEKELWNLTMSDTDISTCTNRFNELATLYPKFVTPKY